ncbi:MAG: hypothetical protein DI602_10170 [Aliarcobacter butzleri]|uniref:hypothetical protein n=1 Tax=Aliarcobacter butzleri TaxID=28197 RepID=UPI000DB739C3|nr:hypothetical protein [Aliarcobacter butzleri]PZP12128.1 MAG: hypothetical protein DI602_10170 [Aliarcobacter butzleri]
MMEIINNLSNKSIVIGALIVLFVFAGMGAYIKYLQYQVETKSTALTQKIEDNRKLKEAFSKAKEEHAKELELEKNKAAYQATTLKEIEQVIKATSKVKQEEIKRGEIKDEKDSNFILTKF